MRGKRSADKKPAAAVLLRAEAAVPIPLESDPSGGPIALLEPVSGAAPISTPSASTDGLVVDPLMVACPAPPEGARGLDESKHPGKVIKGLALEAKAAQAFVEAMADVLIADLIKSGRLR